MGIKLYSFKVGMKRMRKKEGYTQQSFVEAYNAYCEKMEIYDKDGKTPCSITLESVRNWEQGRSVPEWGTVTTICNMFGCDMDALFGNISHSTHDLEFICNETGLSENSVQKLQYLKKHTKRTKVIDFLLNSANFENSLLHYELFLENAHLLHGLRKIRTDKREAAAVEFSESGNYNVSNVPDGDENLCKMIEKHDLLCAREHLTLNEYAGFIIQEVETMAKKKGRF